MSGASSYTVSAVGLMAERMAMTTSPAPTAVATMTPPSWKDRPEGTHIKLDYAFAERPFSEKLHLRAGKMKRPFGISTEIFAVGTLRPFAELPQAVYGPVGLVGENYKGIGFTGLVTFKCHWELEYDIYGGGQELEEFFPPEAVAEGEEFEDPIELERTKDILGGRVRLETPVAGLSFGVSVYIGNEIGSERRTSVGVQAEAEDGPVACQHPVQFLSEGLS